MSWPWKRPCDWASNRGTSRLDSRERKSVCALQMSVLLLWQWEGKGYFMPEGTGIGAMHSSCQCVFQQSAKGLLPWKQIISHQNANCKINKVIYKCKFWHHAAYFSSCFPLTWHTLFYSRETKTHFFSRDEVCKTHLVNRQKKTVLYTLLNNI